MKLYTWGFSVITQSDNITIKSVEWAVCHSGRKFMEFSAFQQDNLIVALTIMRYQKHTFLNKNISVYTKVCPCWFSFLTVCRLMMACMNSCVCDEIWHDFIWHTVIYRNMAVRIRSPNPDILPSTSKGKCGFSLFTSGIFGKPKNCTQRCFG